MLAVHGTVLYCVKCKLKTDTSNTVMVQTKNNRMMLKGVCSVCGSKKCSFISQKEGGKIDIHSLIGKLPRPKGGFTLPNHKYTGPWNPLDKQLDANDNPLPGQEPYNQVDAIAMKHDICYRDHEDDKHDCDRQMISDLTSMKPKNLREKVDRAFVKGVIRAKVKFGLGNQRHKCLKSPEVTQKNLKRGPLWKKK